MEVQIFHKGAWHTVSLPQPFWTMDQKLLYGKVYKLAEEKYDSEKAGNFAEAYVLKQVHTHLKFDGAVESAIKGLLKDYKRNA